MLERRNSTSGVIGFLSIWLSCKYTERFGKIMRVLGSCAPGVQHVCLFVSSYALTPKQEDYECITVNMGTDDKGQRIVGGVKEADLRMK